MKKRESIIASFSDCIYEIKIILTIEVPDMVLCIRRERVTSDAGC